MNTNYKQLDTIINSIQDKNMSLWMDLENPTIEDEERRKIKLLYLIISNNITIKGTYLSKKLTNDFIYRYEHGLVQSITDFEMVCIDNNVNNSGYVVQCIRHAIEYIYNKLC